MYIPHAQLDPTPLRWRLSFSRFASAQPRIATSVGCRLGAGCFRRVFTVEKRAMFQWFMVIDLLKKDIVQYFMVIDKNGDIPVRKL